LYERRGQKAYAYPRLAKPVEAGEAVYISIAMKDCPEDDMMYSRFGLHRHETEASYFLLQSAMMLLAKLY
jgi:hypothetical protein